MAFTIFLWIFGLATHVIAQTNASEHRQLETKLEALQGKAGIVVVRGSSEIGTISGNEGGEIRIRAIGYLDINTGDLVRGIEFFITAEHGSHPQIDYDEIDSLVKAIDQLSTLDKNIIELEKFEAVYRTRCNMTVSLLEDPFRRGLSAVIDGNVIGGGIVILTIEKLGDLKRLVSEAKTRLDSMKKHTK